MGSDRLKHLISGHCADIFDIESGLKFIDDSTKEEEETALIKQGNRGQTDIIKRGGTSQIQLRDFNDETCFPSSIAGLDQAKRAVRFQMARIVNEVRNTWKETAFPPISVLTAL